MESFERIIIVFVMKNIELLDRHLLLGEFHINFKVPGVIQLKI